MDWLTIVVLDFDGGGSEFDGFAHAGERRLELEPLLNFLRQHPAWFILAVGQHHSRCRGRQGAEPGEQIALASVGAEAAEGVDLRLHGDLLAVDAHEFLAVDKTPPKRAISLIADNKDMR